NNRSNAEPRGYRHTKAPYRRGPTSPRRPDPTTKIPYPLSHITQGRIRPTTVSSARRRRARRISGRVIDVTAPGLETARVEATSEHVGGPEKSTAQASTSARAGGVSHHSIRRKRDLEGAGFD